MTEILKKDQTKIQGLKNTVSEIKNELDETNSRLDAAEEMSSLAWRRVSRSRPSRSTQYLITNSHGNSFHTIPLTEKTKLLGYKNIHFLSTDEFSPLPFKISYLIVYYELFLKIDWINKKKMWGKRLINFSLKNTNGLIKLLRNFKWKGVNKKEGMERAKCFLSRSKKATALLTAV